MSTAQPILLDSTSIKSTHGRFGQAIERLSNPRLLLGVIVAGCVCRLAQYFSYRSFWNDEALLVLNIRAKSAAALLQGLDFNQAAPPLFLLIERGMYRIAGGSEWSLRLFPLLAGLASLVIFAAITRRLCTPIWALAVVAVFAFSERLVWHASEVKPYSSDVLVAALLLLAAGARSNVPFARRTITVGLLGTIGVWLSYPAIFVFAGVSLLLLIEAARQHKTALGIWFSANVVVAASFVGVLLLTAHHQAANSQLVGYWDQDFADFRHPASLPGWLLQRLFATCAYPAPLAGPVVAALALAALFFLIRQQRWGVLAMLAGPACAVIVAAALHRYPFDGARLTAFLIPAILLLTAVGGAELQTRIGNTGAVALLAWLIVLPASLAAWHLIFPQTRTHVRPAIAYMRQRIKPDDGIYALAEREFDCYWPANDPRVRYAMDKSTEIPFRRFWVICVYPNKTRLKRLQPLLKWTGSVATRQGSGYTGAGAGAYLFERTGDEPVGAQPVDPPSVDTHHKMMRRSPGSRPQQQPREDEE